MKVILSKKAVSGLIVAVLLVAVALTIGGLVMGWISGYTDTNLAESTENQKEQDECFKRDFKVVSVNVTEPISGLNGTASIIIENKNEETIKGFLLKFITSSNELFAIDTIDSYDNLGAYERITYKFNGTTADAGGSNYPFEYTLASRGTNPSEQNYTIQRIEVLPKVDVTVDVTTTVVCSSKLKTVESDSFISNQ